MTIDYDRETRKRTENPSEWFREIITKLSPPGLNSVEVHPAYRKVNEENNPGLQVPEGFSGSIREALFPNNAQIRAVGLLKLALPPGLLDKDLGAGERDLLIGGEYQRLVNLLSGLEEYRVKPHHTQWVNNILRGAPKGISESVGQARYWARIKQGNYGDLERNTLIYDVPNGLDTVFFQADIGGIGGEYADVTESIPSYDRIIIGHNPQLKHARI